MPTRFGVTKVGVRDGRKLRKVVGQVFITAEDHGGDRYWELLSCGHEGKPIGDDDPATQRWCVYCKWEAEREG